MKKLLALLAALTLCLGCAFAEEIPSSLKDAKSFLYFAYRDVAETTPVDYEVIASVDIGGTVYPVEWSADSDTIKFVPAENGMVTVDVDEQNPEELHYNLTATITDGTHSLSVSFPHKVPASINLYGKTEGEVAEFLCTYLKDNGQTMPMQVALKGKISRISDPYSEKYGNITLYIVCDDKPEYEIQCYRLSGEGADKLAVGDEIGVMGTVKNYKGTIEFDKPVLVPADCTADLRTVLDAFTLEVGASKPTARTITGTIVKAEEYSEKYGNVNVYITVGGQSDYQMECYRLSGEGADNLAVGDIITVTGIIKNYKGTIEFDQGCTLDAVVKAQ